MISMKEGMLGPSLLYTDDGLIKLLKNTGFTTLKVWNQAMPRFVKSGEECFEHDHKSYVQSWAQKLELSNLQVLQIKNKIINAYDEIFKNSRGPAHVQVLNLRMFLAKKEYEKPKEEEADDNDDDDDDEDKFIS